MTFASRHDAGQRLGAYLLDAGVQVDCILGLPRGGVEVAAEVAVFLQRPLDVLVVRKIGHPLHREFAVGALAEPDVVVLDEAALGRHLPGRAALDKVIAEESARLSEYRSKFHRRRLDLAGSCALLVDDGLATGATTEAAVLSARKQGARQVIVAAPVASTNAQERLNRVADRVIVLLVDPEFDAVGRYYRNFPEVTDEQVIALLDARM